MQKLKERNTYTPTDAPLIRSNCDRFFNKKSSKNCPSGEVTVFDQTFVKSLPLLNSPLGVMDSVTGSKTSFNNSEVDLLVRRLQDGCCGYLSQKPPYNSYENVELIKYGKGIQFR